MAAAASARWLDYPTKGVPRAANGKANLTAPSPRTPDGHPDITEPGDVIIVNGSAAKDGSNMANAKTVKFADGTRVFNAGSSGDPGTPGAPRSNRMVP